MYKQYCDRIKRTCVKNFPVCTELVSREHTDGAGGCRAAKFGGPLHRLSAATNPGLMGRGEQGGKIYDSK